MLRRILAGQQRVTATLRRKDGRTLHVRKATLAEPAQLKIYTALSRTAAGQDHEAGRLIMGTRLKGSECSAMHSESVLPGT